MNKVKGITTGTYLTKTLKETKFKGQSPKEICSNCNLQNKCKYNKIHKFEDGKVFSNNVSCPSFYFSITSKAIVTTGTNSITGKRTTKTFVGKNEKEALNKALSFQIEMERDGKFKILTRSNESIVDLVKNKIEEDYKLGKVIVGTKKRKLDTLKKISQEDFARKPISKVSRENVVDYLEKLKKYSSSTIKQNYELLCMAFGEAKYQNIISDNFMEGYNRVEKPKSNYKSNHRISLTINEQKELVNYLTKVNYKQCKHKYLLLLLLFTGMRVGEALVLDYEKDIDLKKNQIHIRRTLTKNIDGRAIIGESTKTNNSYRTLIINNIILKILHEALEYKIENNENLLFCKQDGSPYDEGTINSCLKRIAVKLNIGVYDSTDKKGNLTKTTDVHTHMLRGTFATRCAESKMAPAVLKKILGHSDISITMKYYIDVDTEFEKNENYNVQDYLLSKGICAL